MAINHQNNFATNLTSNQIAGVTTTPLDSIPSIDANFYLALDATNVNGKYEVVECTGKTATNVNHAATTYAHTTAEEVRMVIPAEEMDMLSTVSNEGLTLVSDTWAYLAADDPTFTITVPSGAASLYSAGMKIKLTNTTAKYFIIVNVADTVLTVYGGTDYDLVSAAISSIYISHHRAPIGFPLDPTKWTVTTTQSADVAADPAEGSWLNIGTVTIDIPVGMWNVDYQSYMVSNNGGTTQNDTYSTLSTANNSESDTGFSCSYGVAAGAGIYNTRNTFSRSKILDLSTKDTYYLNWKFTGCGGYHLTNNEIPTVLRAVCSYL